ncbi:uncharacterized protein LOC106884136 isoform X1 [Octopus bimaculoides]|uniref:uncharacterized protein LOC106884136 isoform X1 n=1 Tax=Octopus bimaculoides TaxID=37653 RepID=UPI0022E86F98|nr:uncharacterized protein LOC106884136 isoform X1 [Octopus bimaculoides]
MEEGEVSNGCGMMQLENSSNGFSNNNNNNIVSENNKNTFHHQQLQQPTDFASFDETTFVQDSKHNQQNSDVKPKESYEIQSESSSSSTPTYYQKFNTTLGPADRFCVGGAFGYHLGLNRSYCKPSWDAIADMRTYVSDYY